MPQPPTPLVVVAHPDDEILWFAPLVAAGARLVAALPAVSDRPQLSRARERVRSEYPRGSLTFLPLSEAGVYRRSDWSRRRLTPAGVSLQRSWRQAPARRYAENHARLLDHLDEPVRAHPAVYTHNPWGEYGHEEHIQVCHAVMELARRHQRSVWVWDGLPMADLLALHSHTRRDYYDPLPRGLAEKELPVDLSLYRAVKQLYQRHGAWTWNAGYEPPPSCRYLEIVRRGVQLVDPCPPPPRLRRALRDLVWLPQPRPPGSPQSR